NTSLEKWSPSSLRRTGLCEDHFTPESFNSKSVRKALKRNAVPIAYDLSIAQKNSEESDKKRKKCNEQAFNSKQIITEQSVEKNAEHCISDNVIINEQSFQEPPLKTYKPAHLHFDILENEHNMEWMNIEPPASEEISKAVLHPNVNQGNGKIKKNDRTKKIIDTLQITASEQSQLEYLLYKKYREIVI
ncbi:hypothetical protein ALC57_08793, partial [Trachymyrmex cornetzi]